MSTTTPRESPPSHFTELPEIGPQTAKKLSNTIDMDPTDVCGLARAFFSSEGEVIANVVNNADALIPPLLQASRDLPSDTFKVQVNTSIVLEVMAFIRTFRVNPEFLRADCTYSGQSPNRFAVSPSDVDWEQGIITDRFDVAASVYAPESARSNHQIDISCTDTEPDYLTQNPYDWVGYNTNGVRSLVGYEYVETIGSLCDCDFVDESDFESIQMHGSKDDFIVAFSGPTWTTDIAVAPKMIE